MAEKKTKFELAAKVVFITLLLIILYLYALNGRYTLSDYYVFDKWKMEASIIRSYR